MKKRKQIFTYVLMAILGCSCSLIKAQTPLQLGNKLKKELKMGEEHEYEVELKRNQFFFASLMGYDFDMVVQVFKPDGQKLEEFDDNGIAGEFIRIYAEQAGKYKIKLAAFERGTKAGKYILEVKNLQEAASNPQEKVDELFSYWDEKNGNQVPGVAIAILKEGKSIYHKEFGMANLEYNVPLSSKSVFDLASLAKQFTGMAIAILIDQGKVSLEDDIRKHIPEIPDFGETITIGDLLYHKSGLRGVRGFFSIGSFSSPHTFGNQATSDIVLEAIKYQRELNFAVGEEHSYSNTGYIMLAVAVERITKMSFRDWTQENIFTPLGMHQSFANDNPDEIIKNRATAYYYDKGELRYRQENGMALIGSSAVYSTTDDLVKWVRNFNNPKVGGKKVIEMMQKRGKLKNGEEVKYGFGLNITEFKGLKMIQHTGSTHPGFQTLIARFPEQKFALIILTNWGDIDPVQMLGRKILQIYLKDYIKEDNPNPVSEELPTAEVESLSPELLNSYVGDFQFNPNSIVRFRIENGKLTAEPDGEGKHTLFVLSATEFRLEALKAKITFVKDETGKVNQAIVSRGEQTLSKMARIENKTIEPAKPITDLETYTGYYFSPELRVLYQLIVKEGKLYATHPKTGDNHLKEENVDRFQTSNGFFSEMIFLRDEQEKITGFRVSQGSRTRNLLFEKWK